MPNAARRETSLTLNHALLEEARQLGVNVADAAEEGLTQAVRAARARRWREENAAAIEAYNGFIDSHGIPLADLRKF